MLLPEPLERGEDGKIQGDRVESIPKSSQVKNPGRKCFKTVCIWLEISEFFFLLFYFSYYLKNALFI